MEGMENRGISTRSLSTNGNVPQVLISRRIKRLCACFNKAACRWRTDRGNCPIYEVQEGRLTFFREDGRPILPGALYSVGTVQLGYFSTNQGGTSHKRYRLMMNPCTHFDSYRRKFELSDILITGCQTAVLGSGRAWENFLGTQPGFHIGNGRVSDIATGQIS